MDFAASDPKAVASLSGAFRRLGWFGFWSPTHRWGDACCPDDLSVRFCSVHDQPACGIRVGRIPDGCRDACPGLHNLLVLSTHSIGKANR